MIEEVIFPINSEEGEDWGIDAYINRTLAAFLFEEVQSLIFCLQALKTGANQSHQFTQPTHKYPPEVSRAQW